VQEQIDEARPVSLDAPLGSDDDGEARGDRIADENASSTGELFEKLTNREWVISKLSARAASFVRMMADPPSQVLDGIVERQAQAALGRKQGIAAVAPADLTASMVFDFLDMDTSERRTIYRELAEMAEQQKLLAVDKQPGCFGRPMVFKSDHTVCQKCLFVVQCEPEARAAKARLHARFGIAPKPEPRPAAQPPVFSPLEAAIAKHFLPALKQGVNPIKGSSLKLREHFLLCAVLLRNMTLTVADFANLLVRGNNIPPDTATRRAAELLTAYKNVGAIDCEADRYFLRSSL